MQKVPLNCRRYYVRVQRLEGGRILANLEIHETDVSSSADSANLSELPTVGTTVTARFVTFPRFNAQSCVIVFFAVDRVTAFLEFLETWKCQGIWLSSAKRPKVRERSGNLCAQGNLIVAVQQNNLPELYSYCSSLFMRDIHGEFGLISVNLFDILPAILSGKVGIFFCSENPE